ncbi:Glycerol kinase [Camellia lanceoleosa]|uniref:Glycerol kinase n=1 Tax=Camellia lanceoleosa TaxID=1840588 RepID=A0ACC0HUJ1_9ERIC|nr:Glycerol kinase [Camellia lanceoleosa]
MVSESVRFTFRNRPLLSQSSDSLSSSPPKNGCISTKPIIFSFSNSYRPQSSPRQFYPQAGWIEHDPIEIMECEDLYEQGN